VRPLQKTGGARLPNGYEAFLKSSMGAALASDRSP
jgi:hypothetical protein